MRFQFALCSLLRIPHPDLLSDHLTPEQQAQWWAYHQLHPIDGTHDDLRMWHAINRVLFGLAGVEYEDQLHYPYVVLPPSLEEVREEMARLSSQLRPKPGGGYERVHSGDSSKD